jgi:hypothetical protein
MHGIAGPAIRGEPLDMGWKTILELLDAHKHEAVELNAIAHLGEMVSSMPLPDELEPALVNARIAREIARQVWSATDYRWM